MFTRLGRLSVRRRRAVLIATAVFILGAAVLGTGTFARLKSAGFQDPGAQSTKAENTLNQVFGAGDPNVVALVSTTAGTVDSPSVAAAGRRVTQQLAAIPRVTAVFSYWSLGDAPTLRSTSGTEAIVIAHVVGTDTQKSKTYDHVKKAIGGTRGPISVRFGR